MENAKLDPEKSLSFRLNPYPRLYAKMETGELDTNPLWDYVRQDVKLSLNDPYMGVIWEVRTEGVPKALTMILANWKSRWIALWL